MLILDTHVWVWFFDRDPRIKQAAASIDSAAVESGLGVSAISVWEVGMLVKKGRLVLGMDSLKYVQEALAKPHLSLIPLTPEIAIESNRLPGHLHGDPADRIIIATARVLGATLATRDRRIISYAERGFLKVLPV
ncbi:MAG: type II toxin-antitoxin system VapC family toxin [Planctomycetota bacterium]